MEADTILSIIPDGIVTVTYEGEILELNTAYATMHGYESKEELIGKNISSLVPQDQLSRIKEEIEHLQARGYSVNFETIGLSKEGKHFPLLISATVVKDEKSQLGKIVATVKDISNQRAAESELQKSHLQYKAIFDLSRDAIMTLAPPDWKFTSGNPATIEMFGAKDEAEFISLGPWQISPEFQPDGRPSAEKAKEMIEIAMQDGSKYFEWTHNKLHGDNFPATVLLSRITVGDKVFLQATVRDVSTLKKAEQSVQNKIDELEKLNDAMVGREIKMMELKKQVDELEKD